VELLDFSHVIASEVRMDIEALEREVLSLPAKDRARLARGLLDSLDELS
jgi:hypothetical protein